jgi:hypothetical protein
MILSFHFHAKIRLQSFFMLIIDQLFDGRPLRMLTVIDQFSRQSPLIEPRSGFGGRDVVAALDGS